MAIKSSKVNVCITNNMAIDLQGKVPQIINNMALDFAEQRGVWNPKKLRK